MMVHTATSADVSVNQDLMPSTRLHLNGIRRKCWLYLVLLKDSQVHARRECRWAFGVGPFGLWRLIRSTTYVFEQRIADASVDKGVDGRADLAPGYCRRCDRRNADVAGSVVEECGFARCEGDAGTCGGSELGVLQMGAVSWCRISEFGIAVEFVFCGVFGGRGQQLRRPPRLIKV